MDLETIWQLRERFNAVEQQRDQAVAHLRAIVQNSVELHVILIDHNLPVLKRTLKDIDAAAKWLEEQELKGVAD